MKETEPGNAASEEKPSPRQRRSQFQHDIEVESSKDKRSLIISLAWPSLAESILASMVSVVSMIMVGSLGSHAISAVGLVSQPRFVMLAAFMALNVGSTAMVSRFRGAKDREGANKVLNQSIVMTLGITFLLCIVMFFGGESLIRFLAGKNISEETIQGSILYLRIQVYGFPALSITFTINAVLRGVGNTRISFYNNLAANIANVFFNYCLIGGNLGFPALGIAGSSLATVIGQCVALTMALRVVLSGREYVRLDFRKLIANIELPIIRRILNIGLPAMIEQVIMRTGVMLFTIIVTSLGDRSYAAHMIAMNLHQVSFMTGMSFGVAATTLVGQSLGRHRPDLARTYVKMTQNMSYILAFIVAFVLFFGGRFITSFYTDDPELSMLAANMLRIIAIVNPLSNARFVYASALRGAGDSRFSAVMTFVGVLVMRPIISFLLITTFLPFQLGLVGIWIALSSDSIVIFFLSRTRFKRGKWEKIKV